MKKKTVVIIVMCIAILIMAIGYAAFQTQLSINTTGNITTTWNIYFSNISSETTGSAVNLVTPSVTSTTAHFEAGLELPGDKIVYTITLKNGGDIDAIISNIDINSTGPYQIINTISDIKIGDKLAGGAETTFKLTTEFDSNATSIPEDAVSTIDLTMDVVQDTGQTITETTPEVKITRLNSAILNNNTATKMDAPKFQSNVARQTFTLYIDDPVSFASSYTFDDVTGMYTLDGNVVDSWVYSGWDGFNPDYPYTCLQNSSGKASCAVLYRLYSVTWDADASTMTYDADIYSSTAVGDGLFYTSSNTENSNKTYYFRGNVTNNYLTFAGLTWRIVRINEDDSIRIITQDSVGESSFAGDTSNNSRVGYMYGDGSASTYAATHANTNSSVIKTYLDSWYQNNLLSYANLIADAGFCNNRKVLSGTGVGYDSTIYGNAKPQFYCPQKNDLFTLASSTKGNKALTYPVGLITIDEAKYASSYLTNGSEFLTMSPSEFLIYAYHHTITSTGGIGYVYTDIVVEVGVRPVINLKSTVEISGGNGTSTNPYVIK